MNRIFFILFFCLLDVSLMADTITGSCGNKLLWSFDSETGHLDITGSGSMNLTRYPAWTRKNITITSVSFPDSITSIDSYAFEQQALTEVVVPAAVKKFGKNAFANMPTLLRFEYDGIGYADSENGILYNCSGLRYFKGITRMLSYNDALDTVIVTYGYAYNNFFKPSYIDNTFAYDTRLFGEYDEKLKQVKTYLFPDELEEIGDYYLCNAHDVMGMVIPEKVRSIGRGAFLNCMSMDSLVFKGDTLRTIADSAFCNCIGLQYIRLQDSIPPVIHEHTFENVDHSIPVYIPLNATENYRQAPFWSEFFNFVEPELPAAVDGTGVCDLREGAEKRYEDGQLLIYRGNRVYTMMGLEIFF